MASVLETPEMQKLLWWFADRLYNLLLTIILCATAIFCVNLSRKRSYRYTIAQDQMFNDEEATNRQQQYNR